MPYQIKVKTVLIGILFMAASLLLSCKHQRSASADEFTTTVFLAGQNGYNFFRIPALLATEDRLFAFAEARKNSLSDHGEISIVLRFSTDGGKTWSEMITVIGSSGESVQNPTPVYIEEEHRLLLLFTRRTVGTDTEQMIREGSSAGYMGVYMTTSMDQGLTWANPEEITAAVKRSNWNWYSLGPGGAIIMKNSRHYAGRIIVPANHSLNTGSTNDYLGAHVIYSDDRGKSWKIGAVDSEGEGMVNPNETAVTELNNGTLYFNTRNHNPQDSVAHRAVTYSEDGGERFVRRFYHEEQLITPIVHASLCRTAGEIFFIAPYDLWDRVNMSLWRSDDESVSWEYDRQLYDGPSAYSSATAMNDQLLGILMETDDYGEIVFKSLPLDHTD